MLRWPSVRSIPHHPVPANPGRFRVNRKLRNSCRLARRVVTGANFRAALAWGGPDEGCEIGDFGAWNGEASAEIVEEGDFELPAGLGEPEHDVAGVAASHPHIPLHTNASENDIRVFVTKRKISGGTLSGTTTSASGSPVRFPPEPAPSRCRRERAERPGPSMMSTVGAATAPDTAAAPVLGDARAPTGAASPALSPSLR